MPLLPTSVTNKFIGQRDLEISDLRPGDRVVVDWGEDGVAYPATVDRIGPSRIFLTYGDSLRGFLHIGSEQSLVLGRGPADGDLSADPVKPAELNRVIAEPTRTGTEFIREYGGSAGQWYRGKMAVYRTPVGMVPVRIVGLGTKFTIRWFDAEKHEWVTSKIDPDELQHSDMNRDEQILFSLKDAVFGKDPGSVQVAVLQGAGKKQLVGVWYTYEPDGTSYWFRKPLEHDDDVVFRTFCIRESDKEIVDSGEDPVDRSVVEAIRTGHRIGQEIQERYRDLVAWYNAKSQLTRRVEEQGRQAAHTDWKRDRMRESVNPWPEESPANKAWQSGYQSFKPPTNTAWERGYQDYLRGGENPYDPGSDEYAEWVAGNERAGSDVSDDGEIGGDADESSPYQLGQRAAQKEADADVMPISPFDPGTDEDSDWARGYADGTLSQDVDKGNV